MKIVEKPWGREIWVAHTDRYALKIIEVRKGHRSSLQYHRKKHEHIYVDSGRLQVEWENDRGAMETLTLGPGSPFTVISCFSAVTVSWIGSCTVAPPFTVTALAYGVKPG